MCEHPFITCKAGALYCESCGLFLPAYPEQMAKDREDSISKAIGAVMASALPPANKALQAMAQAASNTNNQLKAFQQFAAPLARKVYPDSIAEAMFKVTKDETKLDFLGFPVREVKYDIS